MTMEAVCGVTEVPDVPWLLDAIRRVAPQVGIDAFALSWTSNGVQADLDVGTVRFGVAVRRANEEGAWKRSRSFALAISLPQGGTPLDEAARQASRALAEEVLRLDDGSLHLPVPRPAVGQQPAPQGRAVDEPAPAALVSAWRDAHRELASELRFAAFVALQAMLTEDLYPHTSSLGVPVDEAAIQDAWRATIPRIRAGTAPRKLGLYIHIPYCTVECSFCYCGKTEHFTRNDFDVYVDRLVEEARTYGALADGTPITSVYFGGGTPSLLSPPAMRRLFAELYGAFNVPEGTQVIFEGNPDSLKPNKIEILANEGRVTRLTVGIQTLDPEVQRYVRRYNKKEDVAAAVRAARDHGIPHVNFDCIAGLEGQSMDSFLSDVAYLLTLEPDSIHINGFRPLPRTRFALAGKELDADVASLRDEMVRRGQELLERGGLGTLEHQAHHRTENAANLQEYDLRRQNSSLIGLGYPARSHAFGGYFYARATDGGFVPALREQNAGERRYIGVASPDVEEAHKYMVTNIRNGFTLAEFRDLFRRDPDDIAGDALGVLERLGVAERTPERVVFRSGSTVDALVYRTLLYSPAQLERARQVWGRKYDPSVDYRAQLATLVSEDE